MSNPIMDNKDRERYERELAIDKAKEWGTNYYAKPITAIVEDMIKRECYGKLILKSDIIWDVKTISEAVTEACIVLGLSDEEFSPSYQDKGNQISIRLV